MACVTTEGKACKEVQWGGKMQDNRAVQRDYEPDIIDVRRNPYPRGYEEQRRRTPQRQGAVQGARRAHQSRETEGVARRVPQPRSASERQVAYRQERVAQPRSTSERQVAYRQDMRQQPRSASERQTAYRQDMRQQPRSTSGRQTAYRQDMRQQPRRTSELQPIGRQPVRRADNGRQVQMIPTGGRQSREAVLRERRRRQRRRQRIAIGLWAVCIIAISGVLLLNRNNVSAAEPAFGGGTSKDTTDIKENTNPSTAMIQGLPADKFTAHPDWTENFLTPNEYSRPGEALTEVKDVFVHYTANPGTSAAQNRSYFEQQKDTHKASVSAHFIIGCEGEIIQCVPLDEIAYAVAGRNYDSVSIECCHTSKDGAFSKETYDSLIALLTWLTDAYDLDTSHILRHYDSNGKKCPLYYTEHEDEWEQLKRDVKAY